MIAKDICNRWNVADVTRPPHAVSQVTGLADYPKGRHDVLFNNKSASLLSPVWLSACWKPSSRLPSTLEKSQIMNADMIL